MGLKPSKKGFILIIKYSITLLDHLGRFFGQFWKKVIVLCIPDLSSVVVLSKVAKNVQEYSTCRFRNLISNLHIYFALSLIIPGRSEWTFKVEWLQWTITSLPLLVGVQLCTFAIMGALRASFCLPQTGDVIYKPSSFQGKSFYQLEWFEVEVVVFFQ